MAWQAQLLRLGKLTMSYKSAGERRMYEGLLALVGKRERDAGFADRAEYGIDAMTTDRDEARESVVDLASRRGARSHGAGRPAVKGASRRASGRSGDSGSDDGPSSKPQKTPAELVARRFRELDAFVERHGLDYWDRHADPPAFAQLELGAAA